MLSVTFHNSFFSDQGVTVWIAISWQFEEQPPLASGSEDWGPRWLKQVDRGEVGQAGEAVEKHVL